MILDKSIVKKIIKQNRKAELELYQSCFSFWMSIALKYYANEEDAYICINDTFIKICYNIKKYDQQQNFLTWSKTILIRTIIDSLRKEKKYKEKILKSDDIKGFQISEPEFSFELNELNINKTLNVLNCLPKATKNIINLYIIDEFSHKEISEMMNITVETSKWHVKTGKKKLKEILLRNKDVRK